MSASRPISQSGSHTSRFSHSEASDASQMRRSSSIAVRTSRLCGTRNTPAQCFLLVLEGTEVSWHRADIVRNEHSLLFRRQRQDLRISHAAQSSRLSGQEIQRWLSAHDSAHNGFVEIGVRQKPNLHDKRVVCSSSRARISLSRRLAGSGSALRLPSAHLSFWRIM